jgi:hypothetical protein
MICANWHRITSQARPIQKNLPNLAFLYSCRSLCEWRQYPKLKKAHQIDETYDFDFFIILSSCNKSRLFPPSPSITELFREKRKRKTSRNSISMELFCFLLGGLDYIVTVASPTNGDLRVSLMVTPLFPRFTTFFF